MALTSFLRTKRVARSLHSKRRFHAEEHRVEEIQEVTRTRRVERRAGGHGGAARHQRRRQAPGRTDGREGARRPGRQAEANGGVGGDTHRSAEWWSGWCHPERSRGVNLWGLFCWNRPCAAEVAARLQNLIASGRQRKALDVDLADMGCSRDAVHCLLTLSEHLRRRLRTEDAVVGALRLNVLRIRPQSINVF